jgi:transposase, IS5 family
MPQASVKSNTRRSRIQASAEHVVARQSDKWKLVVRTIEVARTTLNNDMANIVYQMQRYI